MRGIERAILVAALALGCGPGATGGAKSEKETAPASKAAPAPAPALTPARPRVELGSLWAVRRGGEGRGVLRSGFTDLEGGVVGGFGVSGVGPGGGGTGWGTIGVGTTRPGGRSRRPAPPSVTVGQPRVAGGLDKNIIRRYIRRMLPRIRYCYERQLLIKKHLRGTVYVRFTIDPQGRVPAATASGVDTAVSSCVAAVIKRLRFPKPPGGGLVHVTYPFQFRPGGTTGTGGVTPLEPPPAPPEPKPLLEPKKPRPIDAPESPVVRKVTEPPPPPRGPLACHPASRPDGLEAILPAAEACYEHLLDREPQAAGRLFVTLTIDAAGVITDTVVEGIADRHLAVCVARAAKGLVLSGAEADALRDGKAIFSLYLTKDGGEEPVSQSVTATDHDLRLGLRLMASEVAWNKVDALQRAAWKRVASEATDEPLVLQIADEIDAGAVVAATMVLGKRADELRYARELEGGGWKVVNPLGDGTFRGVCPGQPASRVSVMIDRDGIWVGTDKGRELIRPKDGAHDLLGYARLLRTLRRRELADRSDLELAVTPGVPYGIFARSLEIAIETGFHDAEVRPVSQIRNPRRQAQRQP